MLCKVCRDDLPEARFHSSQYQSARVNCNIPTCIQCGSISKGDRRKLTSKVLSLLAPGGKAADKAKKTLWNSMDRVQKREMQMENRTPSERKLEAALTARGIKHKVQHEVGAYWADFFIPEANLVVEVDGSIHDTKFQKEHDIRRTKCIEKMGYMVIRFTNERINKGVESVVDEISKASASLRGVSRKQRKKMLNTAVMTRDTTIFVRPVFVPRSQLTH